jgi:ribosomal protein L13E
LGMNEAKDEATKKTRRKKKSKETTEVVEPAAQGGRPKKRAPVRRTSKKAVKEEVARPRPKVPSKRITRRRPKATHPVEGIGVGTKSSVSEASEAKPPMQAVGPPMTPLVRPLTATLEVPAERVTAGSVEPHPSLPKPRLEPLVFIKARTGVRAREGRGFSYPELEMSGIRRSLALKMGLRVDPRRRSVHEENVSALKSLKPKP